MQKIVPFLWFNGHAEEAAKFYVSVFKNAKLGEISRYTEGAPMPAGTAMTASFELDGMEFIALNGGPEFTFTEAISMYVRCESQAEVDYYWNALTEGGEESQCGWLKDRFGLSWQMVPNALTEMLSDADGEKAGRVMQAMLQMRKIDVATLKRAYEAAA